ncbi:hypothetical protein FHT12_000559 [Xanthomonas campestris]|uniref:hypothetical protein n=1 Tax=Xanthomonas euroxanthea TaxID=2259622 RepID=UPI000CEE2DCB|nr:hypothetical protein [Xanthomonas euroxanthea]NIJ91901.1 hypothetical protein [Xanthomonas euroxanthea]PPT33342.1 hypothetical protein XaCFBP7622_01345 [Xanthomonas arboricola]
MAITWSDRIRALEGHGRSLTEIGRLIGKSPQAVSDIKQGRTREPGGMAAVRLHSLYLDVVQGASDMRRVDAIRRVVPLLPVVSCDGEKYREEFTAHFAFGSKEQPQ